MSDANAERLPRSPGAIELLRQLVRVREVELEELRHQLRAAEKLAVVGSGAPRAAHILCFRRKTQ